MLLAEIVEGKKEALRVAEVAQILDVSIKKIYRMAAKGQIPSLKISSSIRFDPHDIAAWLRSQSGTNSIPVISLSDRLIFRRRNVLENSEKRQNLIRS